MEAAGGEVKYQIALANALAVSSKVPADEFRKLPHVESIDLLGNDADPLVSAAIVLDRPGTGNDVRIVEATGAVSAEAFNYDTLHYINVIRVRLSALAGLERYPQFKRIEIYTGVSRVASRQQELILSTVKTPVRDRVTLYLKPLPGAPSSARDVLRRGGLISFRLRRTVHRT